MNDKDSQTIQAKLNELGGALIGGATGEMAGAAIGGAIVCLVAGPLGLCGSVSEIAFATGVVGSKLGSAIANTINSDRASEPLWENVAEKMSEVSPEVAGGLAGLMLYGHAGEVIPSRAVLLKL